LKSFRNVIVTPQTLLRDAISRIDSSGLQVALVLHDDGRLAGILTDGDVRRLILRGCNLNALVAEVMNLDPLTAHISTTTHELMALMRHSGLHHIPLLDDEKKVADLATLDVLAGITERSNWVVLMAGGLGKRLLPLTEDCPKPMLNVGGKPILKNIIESFVEQGFRKFFLSVNYLAEIIQDYFGDGGRHGVEILYLHEKKPLGTAGALSLLQDRPTDPVIVMNGDLLTRMRFDRMVRFHEDHAAMATMAVREYDFSVPYGVVNINGTSITSIDEKPVHRFFVNAGIYTLAPESLEHIPSDMFFDMPTLFQSLQTKGQTTAAYPLCEYWLDVGCPDELERARREWKANGDVK
jgi:dTDP-glucose pyrophosphorylase